MLDANRSVVGIPNNPTIPLDFTRRFRVHHTSTQVDLSALVIEHDDGEAREGWDGEVWEWDAAGSKKEIAVIEVAEECDKGSLKEESEVGVVVQHSLLRDGQVTGLANHEIRPLYAHNGD